MASNDEDTVKSLRASFQAKENEWERARSALEARISTLADQSTAAKRALDLEKKLTQAGSHLKTLAQENARLTKLQQAADQAQLNQEKDDSRLKESEQVIEQLKATIAESTKQQNQIIEEKDELIKQRDKELQNLREEQQHTHQKEVEKLKADNQTYIDELEKLKADNQTYFGELEQLKAEKQASVESVHNLEQEIEKLRSAVATANEKEAKTNGIDSKDDGIEELKETFQARERELMDLVEALDTLANANKSVVDQQVELPTTPLIAKIKELEALVESNTTKTENSSNANDSNDKEFTEGYLVRIKEQEQTIKALQAEVADVSRKSTDTITTSVEAVLSKIIKSEEEDDDDDINLNNSLPISLLRSIENLREFLQQQKEKDKELIRAAETSSTTAQSELKRQVTSLQLQINQLNDDREQLQSDKDSLQERLSAVIEGSEASKQMKLTLDDLNSRLETVTADRDTARKSVQELEANLLQMTNSKNHLEKEHNLLLEKLSAMKNALAPRLQANQDENKKLRENNAELLQACEDLRRECENLHAENNHVRKQLENRDQEAVKDIGRLEKEINGLKHRVEKLQSEREEWELRAMEESTQRVQLTEQLRNTIKDAERTEEELRTQNEQRESERTSLANLQAVLEEFQTSKELEIRGAVERMEHQLETAKKSLAEYQERATVAENELQQFHRDVERSKRYEQEIKEKNLLIGKLRHEAIILNEHLVEAMKRIKEGVSDTSVDRQLITNLLVGFLIAPRGDRKRYDILNVIASVLQLSDEHKEQIGLIRRTGNRPSTGGAHTPSPKGWMSPTGVPDGEDDKESFTDAWISFLLKEANRSGLSGPHSLSNTSTPRASVDLDNNRPV